MLTKLYRVVRSPRHRVELVVAATHDALNIFGGGAAREVITAQGLAVGVGVTATRRCHEGVDKTLKLLVVLEAVAELVIGEVGARDVNVQTARLVHLCASGIEDTASLLKSAQTAFARKYGRYHLDRMVAVGGVAVRAKAAIGLDRKSVVWERV